MKTIITITMIQDINNIKGGRNSLCQMDRQMEWMGKHAYPSCKQYGWR